MRLGAGGEGVGVGEWCVGEGEGVWGKEGVGVSTAKRTTCVLKIVRLGAGGEESRVGGGGGGRGRVDVGEGGHGLLGWG